MFLYIGLHNHKAKIRLEKKIETVNHILKNCMIYLVLYYDYFHLECAFPVAASGENETSNN